MQPGDPGRLSCFPGRRSLAQHASHWGFHPSVTQQLWLPQVPLLWRRILLCAAVSDQSHGGQVTELKFPSVPYQSAAHETHTPPPPPPTAGTQEHKQRLFVFFVLVYFEGRSGRKMCFIVVHSRCIFLLGSAAVLQEKTNTQRHSAPHKCIMRFCFTLDVCANFLHVSGVGHISDSSTASNPG